MRECDLLEHIYRSNVNLPDHVTIPPGDDMACVRVPEHVPLVSELDRNHQLPTSKMPGLPGVPGLPGLPGGDVLVTVDQLADGVHFDLATTAMEKIARKAITRNLSDVAAMAGWPQAAVVAASLPRDLGQDRAIQLFNAMRRTGDKYNCPLVGGDISIWDHPLILTVTVLASPHSCGAIRRRGAKIGDIICVTGQLGGSLETVNGYTHHLDFEPRLELARTLADSPKTRPNCMIDLSDGLAKDLGHLCRAAGVSAQLWVDQLPISPAASAAALRDGIPAWQHALGDGEDYELCFTISESIADSILPVTIDGVAITRVGRIVDSGKGAGSGNEGRPAVHIVLPDGTSRVVDDLGWEHGDKD